MISPKLQKLWPSLARQLRDTQEGVLSDPLGETHIDLAFACKRACYDVGSVYLEMLVYRSRAPKPDSWTHAIAALRGQISLDALRLGIPPELPDEVLASPKVFAAARAAA